MIDAPPLPVLDTTTAAQRARAGRTFPDPFRCVGTLFVFLGPDGNIVHVTAGGKVCPRSWSQAKRRGLA